MKILVTGGAGFMGSHIVDAYLKEGHQVAVVDNLSRGKRENVAKEANFYPVNIRDQEKLDQVFRAEKPEILNHHAAQIDLRKSVDDPASDAATNIIGSVNLFELALKYSLRKIIFASTGGALYGEQEHFPADEKHPLRPLSPYGIAKAAAELYLFYYQAVQSIESVILRYSNVYGPRQDPFGEAGVVAIFAEKLWHNTAPTINGPGDQTRDFVYVGDVVDANILALKEGINGAFNIATGKESSVNQIYKALAKVIGVEIDPVYGPAKKGEQLRSVLDPALAKKVLGWEPNVDLKEGLKLTAEFFKPKA